LQLFAISKCIFLGNKIQKTPSLHQLDLLCNLFEVELSLCLEIYFVDMIFRILVFGPMAKFTSTFGSSNIFAKTEI